VTKSLAEQGYFVLPSQTNFVLFEIEGEAKQWAQHLEKLGVYIRDFQFNNQNWLRVTLGRQEEMEIFLNRLKQVKSSYLATVIGEQVGNEIRKLDFEGEML